MFYNRGQTFDHVSIRRKKFSPRFLCSKNREVLLKYVNQRYQFWQTRSDFSFFHHSRSCFKREKFRFSFKRKTICFRLLNCFPGIIRKDSNLYCKSYNLCWVRDVLLCKVPYNFDEVFSPFVFVKVINYQELKAMKEKFSLFCILEFHLVQVFLLQACQ